MSFLAVLASLITIFVFVTGKPYLREIVRFTSSHRHRPSTADVPARMPQDEDNSDQVMTEQPRRAVSPEPTSTSPPSPAQHSVDVRGDDNLVAHHPFEGNGEDVAVYRNRATVHGATLIADRFDNANSAYSFDGVNDYIEVPHHAPLNFGNGDFTICCWISMDQLPAQDVRVVGKFARDRTGPVHDDNYGYALVVWANGIARAGIGEAGTGAGVSSLMPLDTGRWYFLTAVRASGQLKLYVDAQIQGSVVNPRDGDNEASLELGACKTDIGDARWFPGCLDDIRIYRAALTSTDIDHLFREGGWPR